MKRDGKGKMSRVRGDRGEKVSFCHDFCFFSSKEKKGHAARATFGMEAMSYTRTAADPTKYLYNGGVEQNNYTSYYETFYRQYDASIGRFGGMDIIAGKYSSQTPYNYALNDPIYWNDPMGDDVTMSNELFTFLNEIWENTPEDGIGTYSSSGGYHYYEHSGSGEYKEVGGYGSTYYSSGLVGAIWRGKNNKKWYKIKRSTYSIKQILGINIKGFTDPNMDYGVDEDQEDPFKGKLFEREDATEAFQFMIENSYEKETHKPNGKVRKKPKNIPIREVSAWITNEGILVQPWRGPEVDKEGKVTRGWRANTLNQGEGAKSYNNYLPLDLDKMQVFFNGKWHNIIGQIHTHPLAGPTQNQDDIKLSERLDIPVYNIDGQNIYDSSGNQRGTVNKPSKYLFEK